MFDNFGKSVFIINYENNIVNKYEGYAIWPLSQYKLIKNRPKLIKGDTLNVGDRIKYNFLVANIPYSKKTFKVETIGLKNFKIKRKIKNVDPNEVVIEEILSKRGLNRIKAIVQYQFRNKVTLVLNDTVSFDIYVR